MRSGYIAPTAIALARAMFRYSIVYLAALFSALLVDHYWQQLSVTRRRHDAGMLADPDDAVSPSRSPPMHGGARRHGARRLRSGAAKFRRRM